MANEYAAGFVPSDIPLYATQGGGFATSFNGGYVWHSEIPDGIFAQVGDRIPEEWGVAAANAAAHQDQDDALMDGFDFPEEDDWGHL